VTLSVQLTSKLNCFFIRYYCLWTSR